MLNIAVFGSGRGSNFQAILTSVLNGTIPGVRIALVISNNSTAGILDIARQHRIPALHISRAMHGSEDAFFDALAGSLDSHGCDFILLAGYMKRLDARLVERFRGRVINIHPALLPGFGGQGMFGHNVHEAVIASGEKQSGATVHFVDAEYDHGGIIRQATVPVSPEDTADTLAGKVLTLEHDLYPAVLRDIAAGIIPIPAFTRIPVHNP